MEGAEGNRYGSGKRYTSGLVCFRESKTGDLLLWVQQICYSWPTQVILACAAALVENVTNIGCIFCFWMDVCCLLQCVPNI
jgi:hypothetical protein